MDTAKIQACCSLVETVQPTVKTDLDIAVASIKQNLADIKTAQDAQDQAWDSIIAHTSLHGVDAISEQLGEDFRTLVSDKETIDAMTAKVAERLAEPVLEQPFEVEK